MRVTPPRLRWMGGALIALAWATSGHAEMGRTAASWGVSPSGAATYTIPIWVQPGPRGMQPSLAFSYNSQAGNGPMGVGWSLSGFGSIERCPWSLAEDGKDQAVKVDATDRFCLNGNKLRVTSGPVTDYGTLGAEYQTQIATFARVKSIDTVAAPGTGPLHFEVYTKDGRILEFGNSQDSRVVLSGTTVYRWLLSKVRDRDGNSYTITYHTNNSEGRVPLAVSWGPTTANGSTYQYRATFIYSDKSSTRDYVTVKQGSDSITTKKILDSVVIGYDANGSTYSPKRQYFLTYAPSPVTGRSRLTEIKECATGPSNCLKPTTIGYQNGAAGVSSSPTTAVASGNALVGKYDFNGDGRTDIAYYSGTLKVAFSTGAGFTAGVDTGITGAPLVGHFVASNKDGFLIDIGGTWSYVGYNGTSFSTASTGAPVATGTTSGTIVSDYNGDGIQDLVWSSNANSGGTWTGYANLRLNTTTGSASVPSFDSTVYQPFTVGLGNFGGNFVIVPYSGCPTTRLCDVNGDGAADLSALVVSTAGCSGGPGGCTPTQTGSDLVTSGSGYFLTNGTSGAAQPYLGIHFNDDRCTDSIKLSATTMKVHGCGSGAATVLTIPSAPVAVLDWDGDGRTDIAVNNGGVIGVYRSSGTTTAPFSSLETTSVPYNSGCTYLAADVEGDGLDELVCFSGSGVIYYSHNGNGSVGAGSGTSIFVTQWPDVASSFIDGYGVSVIPMYVATPQSNYIRGENTQLPLKDVTKTLLLVGRLRVSDGIGTSYDLDYTYKGARVHGRLGATAPTGTSETGSLDPKVLFGPEGKSAGFEEISIVDSRNGVKQRTTYKQLFPLTGMVWKFETFQPNATPISFAEIDNRVHELAPTETNNWRYFPYVFGSSTELREVGGDLDGDLITTRARTITYDFAYGNVLTDTIEVTDKDPIDPAYVAKSWKTITTNTYSSALTSGSDWCIGFVEKVVVEQSSTASGVETVTRTVGFERDDNSPEKCRVEKKKTEPLSEQYRVTETYGFDDFGNIDSVSVVGRSPVGGGYVDMPARTTLIDWGATGRSPVSVTDPSGATSTFAYNHDTATLLKVADSNSTPSNLIETSYEYDLFARKTKETAPDGTYTTWIYADCVSTGCVYPTHKLTITATAFDNLGGPIFSQYSYFDGFDRLFVTRTPLLSGEQWSETQYDALGRVHKQFMPCMTMSASISCRTGAVTNTYDILNRLTQSSRPQTEEESTPQLTTYEYQGRKLSVTDALGQTTSRVTNVDSSIRQIEDANHYRIFFTYDAAGNIKGITDSQPATRLSAVTIHYGVLPFHVEGTDSALGHYTRTYNSLGELIGWTDAKGQVFTATFDNLSRPLTHTGPGMSAAWEWGNGANNAYNKGLLKKVSSVDSAGTYEENYSYDNRTRLTTTAISIPGQGTFSYDYSYEAHKGWLDTLIYPESAGGYRLALRYAYQNGILKKVSDDSTEIAYWDADGANAWGQVTEETLGNGVVTTREFDSVTGRLSSIQSGQDGSPNNIQNLSYVYDLVGNVARRENSTLAENFYYGGVGLTDKLYRLEHSTLDNGSGENTNLSLEYDASGNIKEMISVDQPDRLISQSIVWTADNYPAQIIANGQIASFSYGPDRQRWKMNFDDGIHPLETTYYIGGLLEKVVVDGAVVFRHTIQGGRGPVALYSRWAGGSALRYVLADHQGSVDTLVDSSNVTHASFAAFGLRRDAMTWSGEPSAANRDALDQFTRQGYTYQTVLGSMGLNHMNGRVQDATTGRFISADPYIADPSSTQGYNRYSYVQNNPLSFSDPSGFNAVPDGCLQSDVCRDTIIDWSEADGQNPCMTPLGGWLTPGACGYATGLMGWGGAVADSMAWRNRYPPIDGVHCNGCNQTLAQQVLNYSPGYLRLIAEELGNAAAPFRENGDNPFTGRWLSQRELNDQKFFNVVNVAGAVETLAVRAAARASSGGAQYVYRGVHSGHPAYADAAAGRAVPGNLNGSVTPLEHNIGGPGVSASSPYTSWTTNMDKALQHANKTGPGGLMLRVPAGAPPPGASWQWVPSPNRIPGESEVLMKGVRDGCTVILCVR